VKLDLVLIPAGEFLMDTPVHMIVPSIHDDFVLDAPMTHLPAGINTISSFTPFPRSSVLVGSSPVHLAYCSMDSEPSHTGQIGVAGGEERESRAFRKTRRRVMMSPDRAWTRGASWGRTGEVSDDGLQYPQ
jgi:hypothetical protein